MMPPACCGAAYLVTTYAPKADGALGVVGCTVCFDLALALDLAESDHDEHAPACVFALSDDGDAGSVPLAGFGLELCAAESPESRLLLPVRPQTLRS